MSEPRFVLRDNLTGEETPLYDPTTGDDDPTRDKMLQYLEQEGVAPEIIANVKAVYDEDEEQDKYDLLSADVDDLAERLRTLEDVTDIAHVVNCLRDITKDDIWSIRIKRTTTPDNPPKDLHVGELAIELAEPRRLWIGVPPEIDWSGKLMLVNLTALDNLVQRVAELEKALLK